MIGQLRGFLSHCPPPGGQAPHVRDLERHLRQRFGTPDVDGPTRNADLSGKRGLLLFTVGGWNNATGHATLWDGHACSDRCYFPESSRVAFWELK